MSGNKRADLDLGGSRPMQSIDTNSIEQIPESHTDSLDYMHGSMHHAKHPNDWDPAKVYDRLAHVFAVSVYCSNSSSDPTISSI